MSQQVVICQQIGGFSFVLCEGRPNYPWLPITINGDIWRCSGIPLVVSQREAITFLLKLIQMCAHTDSEEQKHIYRFVAAHIDSNGKLILDIKEQIT